ncbi:MAG: hypothetical protein KJ668_20575 [Proteobacteria bacterium]|nr:hypothetical protein [Pseudomonadota bacterium]
MGKIAAHAIKDPKKAAQIVFTCGKNLYAIGKTRLKCVIFSRENQKNFFIFPVGNYYLGVIKSDNMNNIILADTVIKFLKGLLKEK